uniref:Uncharacterized protein n=1 Tax=Anguilla anguilla TaxID=7936 RepID=A0A0E9PRD2_ANGAN
MNAMRFLGSLFLKMKFLFSWPIFLDRPVSCMLVLT